MKRILQCVFFIVAFLLPFQVIGQMIPGVVEEADGFLNGAVSASTTKISSLTTTIYEAFEDVADFLEDAVQVGEKLVENWDQVQSDLSFSLIVIGAILIFGLFAERLAWGLFSGARRRLAAASEGKAFPLLYNLAAMVVDILRSLVFIGVATGVLYYADVGGGLHLVASQLIWMTTIFLGFLVLWRATLAPNISPLRLMPMEDKSALEIYRWGRSVSMLTLYGYWAAYSLFVLGFPESFDDALIGFVGLIVVIRCITFVLHWKGPLTSWMLSLSARKRDLGILPLIARIWHVVTIFYVIAFYYFFIISDGRDVGSALGVSFYTAFMAFLMVGAISAVPALVTKVFQVVRELDSTKVLNDMPALQSVSTLAVQILILVLGASLIGPAWDLDLLDSFGIGERKTAVITIVDVSIILVSSVALWDLAHPAVGLFLRKVSQSSPSRQGKRKRMETLHPLLSAALRALVVIIGGLMAASELGLNILPALAGLGVAGLALGFGSKKLVEDLVNGSMLLIEGTFDVGDQVTIAGKSGIVESLNLRSVQLRSKDGHIHTIPFSSASVISNESK